MNGKTIGPFGKRVLAAVAVAMGVLGPGTAAAEPLDAALGQAYLGNPELRAERAFLRATDEGVPQALSGWRPTVVATGSLSEEYSSSTGVSTFTGVPFSAAGTSFARGIEITLVQPLFRGFRTVAATSEAENTVRAGRASLVDAEQSVLLSAVTAYMDVLQFQAVLELNINNEQVLRRELEATRDRFEVGEVTRTDVAQAESRVAGAVGDRVSAEGDLETARADYVGVIGSAPMMLEQPPPYSDLPPTLEEAQTLARSNNPSVLSAVFTEAAARDDVRLVTGELLPEINLSGSYGTADDPSFSTTNSESGSIGATLVIPIYQAGSIYSQVRQAKQLVSQNRMLIAEAKRSAVETATSTWESLVTTRAQVVAFEEEVRSAKIALEGVQEESLAGLRTVLDVLDAEQEYLDSRVNLVVARHDEVVASYALLAAVGQLTAANLGLDVPLYDPILYSNEVRGKIWGLGSDPLPTPVE